MIDLLLLGAICTISNLVEIPALTVLASVHLNSITVVSEYAPDVGPAELL